MSRIGVYDYVCSFKPFKGTLLMTVETNSELENDAKFFIDIQKNITERATSRHVLVSIPVWGWTGAGKTCALLTAIHYCDAAEHGLGFAIVDDVDDLMRFESTVDEYRGLNLAALAESSKNRLRNLGELFIDNCEWPPGTDELTNYVVSVQSRSATEGYAVFPDLKGGSFRELDDSARNVLLNAHACILLINPEHYVSKTTDGKRYRDEIASRLQKCAERRLPTCIMITKSDKHALGGSSDSAHQRLTTVTSGYKDLVCGIFRVSVIGKNVVLHDERPPPAEERSPTELIKAWIWVVEKALTRSTDELRAVVPLLHNQNRRSINVTTKARAELRQVGEYSGSNGRVIASLPSDSSGTSFLFLGSDNSLTETFLSRSRGMEPKYQSAGSVEQWSVGDNEVQCFHISGNILLGGRGSVSAIWFGTKGEKLTKYALPFDVTSWAPVNARHVVATDKSGRVHSLSLDTSTHTWKQIAYLSDVLPVTPLFMCGVLDSPTKIVVMNGSQAEGLSMTAGGEFGERLTTNLIIKYDSSRAGLNQIGVFVSVSQAKKVSVSDLGHTHELLSTAEEAPCAFAIAPYGRTFALFSDDSRLRAGIVQREKIRLTEADLSPALPTVPTSMCWAQDETALVVTHADGTWSVFRPFGLNL